MIARVNTKQSALPMSLSVSDFTTKLILLSLGSGMLWFVIASNSVLGSVLGGLLVGGISLAITYLIVKRKMIEGVSAIVYLAVIQPALRRHIPQLPYLFLAYAFLFWGAMILIR